MREDINETNPIERETESEIEREREKRERERERARETERESDIYIYRERGREMNRIRMIPQDGRGNDSAPKHQIAYPADLPGAYV